MVTNVTHETHLLQAIEMIAAGDAQVSGGIQAAAAAVKLAAASFWVQGDAELTTDGLHYLGRAISTRVHDNKSRTMLKAFNSLVREANEKAKRRIDNTTIKRIVDFAAIACFAGLRYEDFEPSRDAFKLQPLFDRFPIRGLTDLEIIGSKRDREGPHYLNGKALTIEGTNEAGDRRRIQVRLSIAAFMRVWQEPAKRQPSVESRGSPISLQQSLETTHSLLAKADYRLGKELNESFMEMLEAFVSASPENRAAVLKLVTDTENKDSRKAKTA